MTTTTTAALDGLVYDMDDADYRAVPRISQSGLKTILDCPARYAWESTHRVEKRAYDEGHIVHALVLGRGLNAAIIDAASWAGKKAQEEEAAARAAGLVPILAKDYARCQDMAAAIADHPIAGPMMAHPGYSEVAMLWTDPDTGTPCKALADRRLITSDGRHWLPDVKTTSSSAAPAAFGRTAAQFGYHVQAAFYTDAYELLTGVRPEFPFVVVEKTAPHLVSVVNLDDEAVDVGRSRYRDALDTYTRCTETGVWPGYTETLAETVALPRWATY